uniref:thiamine biosynthesis protein ThiS n=1 Tax=Pachymeniopsis lanceolata TaxID=151733 RepID=UPI002A7FF33C|nr:thiamine biosynthesis protein ThiS [Pachymeniopsis lanceolata]WOL37219.1 thiamine biosynthesis protein ThiS [Pachymeniopsis lanceolata]
MKYNAVFVNGQVFNCHEFMSLKDLLIYLDFNIDFIAVEYNSEILDNSCFHNTFMQPQDSIEVITIVGGG